MHGRGGFGLRLAGLVLIGTLVVYGIPGMLGWAAPADRAGEWARVVEAAKREGRLVVYDAFGGAVPTVQYAAERFEATYGIKVEVAVMRASESIERIRVEQRAGRPIADLVTVGPSTVRPMMEEGVLRPVEFLPSAIRVSPQLRAKMEEWGLGQHMLTTLVQLYGILINTNLVRPEAEPRSWMDLLDSRWRGQMIMDDPRAPGGGYVFFAAAYKQLGRRYQEALAEQRPFLTRAIAEAATRVARGEFAAMVPFALGLYPRVRGGPVKLLIPREGAPYVHLGLSFPARSPHPNAARLFAEFFLSREIQLRLTQDHSLPAVAGLGAQAPQEIRPYLRARLWDTIDDPRRDPEWLRRAAEIYR
jgi:iron(III) transport system substrate-binding protein